MEYISIKRSPYAWQQPIAPQQIAAMCRRAFGVRPAQIMSIKELPGGLINNTYLIHMKTLPPVILRVSPPSTGACAEERNLMRNECASQPFLAPVAYLLPQILMTDFTHQLLERDYMFQTFLEGEQWGRIEKRLTPQEQTGLWWQLGNIARKIHAVKGTTFGLSMFGPYYSSWSLLLLEWFADLIRNLRAARLDTTDIRSLCEIIQTHATYLDTMVSPSFLHGDLSPGNILISRRQGKAEITGILDADWTSWGDPLAERCIFHLRRKTERPEAQAFWQAYNWPADTFETRFRLFIYQGKHLGEERLLQHRFQNHRAIQRSYRDMHIVLYSLRRLLYSDRSPHMSPDDLSGISSSLLSPGKGAQHYA